MKVYNVPNFMSAVPLNADYNSAPYQFKQENTYES